MLSIIFSNLKKVHKIYLSNDKFETRNKECKTLRLPVANIKQVAAFKFRRTDPKPKGLTSNFGIK